MSSPPSGSRGDRLDAVPPPRGSGDERVPGDRAVLVTGSTRGIGRAIAEAFAALGDRVVVHGRRVAEAEAVAAALPGRGGHTLLAREGHTLLAREGHTLLAREGHTLLAREGHTAVGGDLAHPGAVERIAADAIAATDGIDVLVNNAGVYLDHPPLSSPLDAWRAAWGTTMQVNLLAAADLTVLVARDLVERGRGGAIVQVGSRGAFRGEPTHPAYGASKAGLHHLAQSCAVAFAPHGIRVTAIAPGFVETDMAHGLLEGPAGAAIRAQSPLGRVGRPDEIARAVVMLADPGLAFATGAILDANGASYLRT